VTVTAWRVVTERYADSAFTGEGARLYNPSHSDSAHIEIGAPGEWDTDPRLLRRAAAKDS
jgi:hypothetical protein